MSDVNDWWFISNGSNRGNVYFGSRSSGSAHLTQVNFNLHTGDYQFGASDSDSEWFEIEVDTDGVTTLKTVDSGGSAGHMTIAPDGDTIFNTDGLVIQDNGDVSTPASGYGTLYVNSDVLYFKNDSGTATNLLAGGGGGSGLNSIVAAMVFG